MIICNNNIRFAVSLILTLLSPRERTKTQVRPPRFLFHLILLNFEDWLTGARSHLFHDFRILCLSFDIMGNDAKLDEMKLLLSVLLALWVAGCDRLIAVVLQARIEEPPHHNLIGFGSSQNDNATKMTTTTKMNCALMAHTINNNKFNDFLGVQISLNFFFIL